MFFRRFPALIVTLALASGNVAVCAGWAATPEARMACCTAGDACPMHRSESGSNGPITQAQADSCCASSERDHSTPSDATVAAALSNAVLGPPVHLPVSALALALKTSWQTIAPVRSTPVPKHVLLSVFLV